METESATSQVSRAEITEAIRKILTWIGEDPNREGLLETPERIIRSWEFLYGGYHRQPADVMKKFVDGACDEMVTLRDIEFYSTCEHHMIPFFGKVHIAYLPAGKVIGVSKLARLVEVYARRMQIQERFTAQVADALMHYLQPRGVMVICAAKHLCMTARGVQKQNSEMITSAIRGAFKKGTMKEEFLRLIKA